MRPTSIVPIPGRRRLRLAALVLAAACGTTGAAAASSLPPLVWHVETADGRVVASREGDEAINPASLVKVATTLWALERLGPDHRFVTRFELQARPVTEGEAGAGPEQALVVHGGCDPDLHPENVFLVAAELNRRGVLEVAGPLVVDGRFWIGWEGGGENGPPDPAARAALMARRLRDALDPRRWSATTRQSWLEFAGRRGLDRAAPPSVTVRGATGLAGDAPSASAARVVVEHHSNPLVMTLERFNAYSNNDIERLAALLGPPEALARELFGDLVEGPSFASLSGLGRNRLTPRQVVELLRELRRRCERAGLALDSVLPVAGCDPGTLQRFPRLGGSAPGAVVAKTGTLVETDGGIAAMAGLLRAADGDRWFCVAIPGSGRAVRGARRALESWVLERLAEAGGPRMETCPAPPGLSDADAVVIAVR